MRKSDFKLNCGHCNKEILVKRKRYFDQIRRDPETKFYCSKECRIAKSKTGKLINCLVCNNEVYKSLGDLESGARFCSTSCAAIFNNQLRPTRDKGKVKKLICSFCDKEYIGSVHTPLLTALCYKCRTMKKVSHSSNCIECGIIIYGSYGKKYCDSCRNKRRITLNQFKVNNGLLFSKSIKCKYLFKNKEIKCDSKLEYVCLYFFNQNYDLLDINRSQIVLQYSLDNKIYNYFPDFEIILTDGTKYLVECKGVVGKKLSVKWNNYNLKSIEKQKALERWCNENGYIPFWFEQKKYEKIYKLFKLIDGNIKLVK